MGTVPAAENAAPQTMEGSGAEAPAGEAAEEKEESIYEVMKATMRRQKEEQDAKNAAMKLDRTRSGGMPGRPGPVGARPAEVPAVVERVSDVADLKAVWGATRRHLNGAARYLESVLGHCCKVETLSRETGETLLVVPGNQKGFTNERARAKIEECMRVVTGLPIRLALSFTEEVPTEAGEGPRNGGGPAAPSQTAQRIPPEVLEAIKAQPLVQELMKRLDASVVHVEMLNTDE